MTEELKETRPRRARKQDADGKEPPAYRPLITGIHTTAKRVVRTGQYENFELSTMINAERDENYSVRENVQNLQQLVIQEVNEACERLLQDLHLEK